MFRKLVILSSGLFVLTFNFLPPTYIYILAAVLIVLNAFFIFLKNKNITLKEVLINVLLFNLPVWFIVFNIITYDNPGKILAYILFFLIFAGFTTILAAIFHFIHKLIEYKKLQVAFNFTVIVFMAVISALLYQANLVNQEIIDTSLTKLQLIENRFGGEEKLRCNESDAVKTVKTSVVRVIGGEGEGSGFVVNDEGYILTNFHVIEFEPAPKIMFSDNSFETPEIIFADKNADLAILRVVKQLPSINWGNSDKIGQTEEVLALGFPFGSQIAGDVAVKKGSVSAKRISKDADGLELLQIDSTLNPGMSGGPLINVCGDFVGINTAGTDGLGLAISSNSFKKKYLDMQTSNEPLKDITKIVFEPDKSPLHTVEAFYNYIKLRKLDKAFALLGSKFTSGMNFENWKKGYSPNIDTSVFKIEIDPQQENIVNIKLATKDLVDGEIINKYFEGWWEIKEVNGHLTLWWPEIQEVKDPGFSWFYE